MPTRLCTRLQIQGASLNSLAAHLTLSTLAVDGAAWGGTSHAALPRPLHLTLPALGGDLFSLLVSNWMADAARQAQRAECPAARHPPPPPPPSPRAFDWRQSFLLELLDLAVQTVKPSGVDELVRMATGGTGALDVPDWLLPHALTFAIPGVATLTVDVARANVSGLDSFTKFELLEPVPVDAAGLYSAIDLDRLEVGLELRLSILGGGGPRQLPPLTVRFSLADVSVDATGRLALDADGIAAMELNQLLNSSCLLHEVRQG